MFIPMYMLILHYSINKPLSYTVFNVTGNKAAEKRVCICRHPDLEWSKAFLSLLSYGKAGVCPQVLWSDKKYTSTSCGHLPKCWKITDFCQTLQPETEHPSMGDNHPQSRSEREREKDWRPFGLFVIMLLSASCTACIARHHSFIKLNYYKCLLILWNTHRTSYLQPKVFL